MDLKNKIEYRQCSRCTKQFMLTHNKRQKICEKCVEKDEKIKAKKVKEKQKRKMMISKLCKECDKLASLYIRNIYKGQPCFTCGETWKVTHQCWHFIERQKLATRWTIDNMHLQCVRCNWFNGWVQYIHGKRINEVFWEWLAEKLIEISSMVYKNTIEDRLIYIADMYDKLEKLWVDVHQTYADEVMHLRVNTINK